jgi:hypothetical protein
MAVLTTTAIAAFQPNAVNMNGVSPFPRVGDHENRRRGESGVSVPPMETFTKRTPIVAYLKRSETPARGCAGRG